MRKAVLMLLLLMSISTVAWSKCDNYSPVSPGEFVEGVVGRVKLQRFAFAGDTETVVVYLESFKNVDLNQTENCGSFTINWGYEDPVTREFKLEYNNYSAAVKLATTAFALNLHLEGMLSASTIVGKAGTSLTSEGYLSITHRP